MKEVDNQGGNMCGIVGGITKNDVGPILLQSLKRLEYRGYDSAGLAVITSSKLLAIKRIRGKVHDLMLQLDSAPLEGRCGIAHTRWATHGEPSELNAHPHVSCNQVAVVHNGIIENYVSLRADLQAKGYIFTSQTDTEVIAHLIHFYLQDCHDLLTAVQQSIKKLHGMFAIGVISTTEPGTIVAARYGSPLVVGLGEEENFIASDSLALLPLTHNFIYLEEFDVVKINHEISIYDEDGEKVERNIVVSKLSADTIDCGRYPHFMLKEIFQQPDCIADTLHSRLAVDKVLPEIFGINAPQLFPQVENITLVACGTSYYAGCVAKYWLEEIAGVACQVEIASEYRYRHPVIKPNSLFIAVSQSGETADTLAALNSAKKQGYLATLVICNVPESSLVRAADLVLLTRAGPEIGVASTKSFSAQLVSLLLLTVALGHYRKLNKEDAAEIVNELYQLPLLVKKVLDDLDDKIKHLAEHFVNSSNALFLGRGSLFPVALEGALKMKEIDYIHAEAYPAGELKHGPLAMVSSEMPVFVLAPDNDLFDKLNSNLEEVKARKGDLVVFADVNMNIQQGAGVQIVDMPSVNWVVAPIIYVLPLQLLAYYIGVLRGNNVDQPRNLAKSVTVE